MHLANEIHPSMLPYPANVPARFDKYLSRGLAAIQTTPDRKARLQYDSLQQYDLLLRGISVCWLFISSSLYCVLMMRISCFAASIEALQLLPFSLQTLNVCLQPANAALFRLNILTDAVYLGRVLGIHNELYAA